MKNIYPPLPEKLYDFRVFLILVWRALSLPDPTPIQLDIASFLSSNNRRKVVEAFRGVGKSWITSAYVMWRLRINPNLKFLVVSAGKDRADNFTSFCMRLMEQVDVLKCMMPKKSLRSSKSSFDVYGCLLDHAPSVKSVGISGQLTGTRADEIIADDVETASNSLTQNSRDKLSEAVKEFDAIIKPKGNITYLGTPQTEQSIYNQLAERGYILRIWPAKYPTGKELDSYGKFLAPKLREKVIKDFQLSGNPTDPKRFSKEDLNERELSYGKIGFAMQFMLDTNLSDTMRYPLKLWDLPVAELEKDVAYENIRWEKSLNTKLNISSVGFNGDCFYMANVSGNKVEYKSKILAIDPSGRGKDETGYAVLYQRDGIIFLMESGGLNGGYSPETLQQLSNIAYNHKVNSVVIESNFGDGMFKELLTPILIKSKVKASITEVRNYTMKEARIIDTLEPVIASHKLIVNKSVIEKDFYHKKNIENPHRYMLFYQLTHIMKEKGALSHDDRLDALSIGVNYFTDVMNQDAEKKAKERKNRILKEELDVFIYGKRKNRSKEALIQLGFTPTITAITHKNNVTISTLSNNDKKDLRDMIIGRR